MADNQTCVLTHQGGEHINSRHGPHAPPGTTAFDSSVRDTAQSASCIERSASSSMYSLAPRMRIVAACATRGRGPGCSKRRSTQRCDATAIPECGGEDARESVASSAKIGGPWANFGPSSATCLSALAEVDQIWATFGPFWMEFPRTGQRMAQIDRFGSNVATCLSKSDRTTAIFGAGQLRSNSP